jgi:2-polyprenyl-3-methyl-5-hydroxy-6-metoxy-1,4-benzoquinol methylase
MLRTDAAWEKFGRAEPYFGVLADEKFTLEKLADYRDEFFASGEGAVAQIIDRCERLFGPVRRERVLDHGCGVGRLTLPLARQFAGVVALDISPSMLVEATQNAERFGLSNIRFELTDDLLSNAAGTFDIVNSHMVLQHVPVRRGLRILSRLLDKVADRGVFHVHFSTRTDGMRSRALWWASHHIPGVKLWQNICARRPWNAPAMQMNNYPLNRIAALLASRGVSEFLVSTEMHAEFLTLSIIGRSGGPEIG